ncbi:TIR domain-containing protein [Chloroflexota bacterium]
MATNVFVSFDHDDQNQVNGVRSLVENPNHPLDFHDHSLKEPVRDWTGEIVKYQPSDPRSKPIRDGLLGKFQNASKMVVLIGYDTWQSPLWVPKHNSRRQKEVGCHRTVRGKNNP